MNLRTQTINTDDEIARLIEETVWTLKNQRLPLNTFLWVRFARALERIPGAKRIRPALPALAFTVIVTSPLLFLPTLIIARIPQEFALLYSLWLKVDSVVVFLSLTAVHIAYLRWTEDADDVATLLKARRDIERASQIMLAAFRLLPQVIFSVVAASILDLLLVLAYPQGPLVARVFLSVPFFLMAFVLGNGTYWALASYVAIYILFRAKELKVNFFDPSSTRGIQKFSGQLTLHILLSSAVLFAILLGFIRSDFQHTVPALQGSAIVWIVVAITVVTATFLYHQILASLIIQREKRRILAGITQSIDTAYSAGSVEEVMQLIKLYESVKGTKSSIFTPSSVLPYVIGVSAQIIPIVTTSQQLITLAKVMAIFGVR